MVDGVRTVNIFMVHQVNLANIDSESGRLRRQASSSSSSGISGADFYSPPLILLFHAVVLANPKAAAFAQVALLPTLMAVGCLFFSLLF